MRENGYSVDMGSVSYCAKYSFLTEPRGVTMREVERIFQLDPEPPIWGNLNDYILEAVQRHNLRWFSFFSSCWCPVYSGLFSFTGFGFSLSQPVTAPVLLVFVLFEF